MTASLANIDKRNDIVERRDVSTQALVFDPETISHMMRMADMMAKATVTVPKHLAGAPADCLAVIMQAAQFQMNPFAVAQKTHLVNGQLGYEAQLVNAVVQNSGAIKGRFHYEYRGEGASVECRVGAVLAGESEVTWGEWLSASAVTTKNSPLWKTNPRQQLGYLQVKNWARQYTPGAILGVYSVDELHDSEPVDMGPAQRAEPEPAASRTSSVKAKLAARTKPQPTGPSLDDVLAAIDAAGDMAALKAVPAGELADASDKAIARKAWKTKQSALKAAADAEADKGEQLADSLVEAAASAKTDDERAEILDAARDLPESQITRIKAAFIG